jgi:hypothetical protein
MECPVVPTEGKPALSEVEEMPSGLPVGRRCYDKRAPVS